MRMFRSLLVDNSGHRFAPQFHLAPEAPGLVGFMCGNTYHAGCLTLDEAVRLHSCEKGNYCQTVRTRPVVWIRPIIARLPDGQDVAEVGIGGGGEDLEREAELDYISPSDAETLISAYVSCRPFLPAPANPARSLCDANDAAEDEDLRSRTRQFLLSVVANGRKVPLDLELSAFGENNESELAKGLQAIMKKVRQQREQTSPSSLSNEDLPNLVTFPYSRHSSYPELCNFVEAFKPRDVWPCTVDLSRWLREGLISYLRLSSSTQLTYTDVSGITIKRLFSRQCSGDQFRHDKLMRGRFGDYEHNVVVDNANSQSSATSVDTLPSLSPAPTDGPSSDRGLRSSAVDTNFQHQPHPVEAEYPAIQDRCSEDYRTTVEAMTGENPDTARFEDSQDSPLSALALETRMHAFQTMLDYVQGKTSEEITLISTTDNHSTLDEELAYGGP